MNVKFEEELQRVIAQRAHELSLQGNSQWENGVTDWLKAESEIMSELDSRSRERFSSSDTPSAV
ncbi:MAG: hypothetical protein OEU95_06940 [Nitrospirota bacterium]|nr:hypothetical protein [Nitrospirota bacterium]